MYISRLVCGVPSVSFYPRTDMNKEMRDNLFFAISTSENKNKSGNEMAKHIAEKMRNIYGGYWSVFASRCYEQANEFNRLKGHYASFEYAIWILRLACL